jgi:SAM-dependent methyltransferase
MENTTETAWDKTTKKDLGSKPSDFLTKEIVPLLRRREIDSILDVGCYNGRNLKYLSIQTTLNAYGVDTPGAKNHVDEINRHMKFMDLKDAAFVTDYTKPLKEVLPVDSVGAALLWRIVHLLTEDELRTVLQRTLEMVRYNGLIFISARRRTDDVKLYASKNTIWNGVTKGKVTKEAPERLYFDSAKALRNYIQAVAPLAYIWLGDEFPSEFSEFEPVNSSTEERVEVPCVCSMMRVVSKNS